MPEQSETPIAIEKLEPEQLGELLDIEVQPRFRPESRVFAWANDGGLGLEQLSRLATRLKHARERFPIKRLLITSAVRGEGKTRVAANLALTLANQSNNKVLLVDADIRKPDLHTVYGVPPNTTANFWSNGARPTRLIRRLAGTNLYVMSLGPATASPLTDSGLLKLKLLLDQVSPAFDIVLLDSPPTLLVSDVALLARVCDAALLVIRANDTPRELAIKARDMLEGIPVLGTVLTRVEPSKLHYGYYNYYRASDSAEKKREALKGWIPKLGQ